jgi:hypothetical protein
MPTMNTPSDLPVISSKFKWHLGIYMNEPITITVLPSINWWSYSWIYRVYENWYHLIKFNLPIYKPGEKSGFLNTYGDSTVMMSPRLTSRSKCIGQSACRIRKGKNYLVDDKNILGLLYCWWPIHSQFPLGRAFIICLGMSIINLNNEAS